MGTLSKHTLSHETSIFISYFCLCSINIAVVSTFRLSKIWKGETEAFLMHFIWLPWWFILSVSRIKPDNVESEVYLKNTAGQICQLTIYKCQHEFKLALAISRWRWWHLWTCFHSRKLRNAWNDCHKKSHIQSYTFMNSNQKRLFHLSSSERKLFSYKPLKIFIYLPFLLK